MLQIILIIALFIFSFLSVTVATHFVTRPESGMTPPVIVWSIAATYIAWYILAGQW